MKTTCPKCKREYTDGVISRRDNITEICSWCGAQEANLDTMLEIEKDENKKREILENDTKWLRDRQAYLG